MKQFFANIYRKIAAYKNIIMIIIILMAATTLIDLLAALTSHFVVWANFTIICFIGLIATGIAFHKELPGHKKRFPLYICLYWPLVTITIIGTWLLFGLGVFSQGVQTVTAIFVAINFGVLLLIVLILCFLAFFLWLTDLAFGKF